MSNVFSSPEFLSAAGGTIFGGRRAETVIVSVEGWRFRLLSVQGRLEPTPPYFDFLEPLDSTPGDGRRADYLPRVSLESVPVPQGKTSTSVVDASPWISWARFSGWEAFLGYVEERGGKAFSAERKRRRLARECGPLRFEADARDKRLLRLCLAWKSRQYRRTGLVDPLASKRTVAFFHRLFDEGLLVVSALSAGSVPVAVHLGCRWDARFYYWVPAYRESAAAHSPGALLLEALLEESYRRGDREFDFLIGDEAYKLRYATDMRLVRELGRPPLPTRMWRPVRRIIMARVRRFERPYRTLQDLKRTLRQWRIR
jgi:hypothetical protein